MPTTPVLAFPVPMPMSERRQNIARAIKKRRETKECGIFIQESELDVDELDDEEQRELRKEEKKIDKRFRAQTLYEKRRWLAWREEVDAERGAVLAAMEADEVSAVESDEDAEEARLIALESQEADAEWKKQHPKTRANFHRIMARLESPVED